MSKISEEQRQNNIAKAAKRALEEAKIRQEASKRETVEPPKEINGRQGPEPTRFGDWEKGGIISDF